LWSWQYVTKILFHRLAVKRFQSGCINHYQENLLRPLRETKIKTRKMKKLLLSLVSIALLSTVSFSQCIPDGIVFSSQEYIDNFELNYPGCSEIMGYVLISGSDITNLDGLHVLTSIGGDLRIGFNASLTNLNRIQPLDWKILRR